jgi:hypothetical protein
MPGIEPSGVNYSINMRFLVMVRIYVASDRIIKRLGTINGTLNVFEVTLPAFRPSI